MYSSVGAAASKPVNQWQWPCLMKQAVSVLGKTSPTIFSRHELMIQTKTQFLKELSMILQSKQCKMHTFDLWQCFITFLTFL